MIYNPFIPLYNHKDCIPKVAFIWDNHTRSSEVLLSNWAINFIGLWIQVLGATMDKKRLYLKKKKERERKRREKEKDEREQKG